MSLQCTKIFQSLEKFLHIAPDTDINSRICVSACICFIVIVLSIFVSLCFYQMRTDKWRKIWNWTERSLLCAFIVVWIFGFCIYLTGMSISEEQPCGFQSFIDISRQTPMAIIHAFGMFILESDIDAIHNEFHQSLYFMTLFSIAHGLAAVVSTLFIIKFFGYNLGAKIKLRLTLWCKKDYELFVFWGINEPTFCLAKSIKDKYKKEDSDKYEIVIVNTTDDDEEMEKEKEHTSIGRLLTFSSYSNSELNNYKELGCLTINVFNKLSKIITKDDNAKSDILEGKMRARALTKLIKHTNKNVHFFLLNENENDNITSTCNLCNDSTISALATKNRKFTIYCHARYDSINRIIEDKYSTEYIEVKVVDSSHDSINILRSTPEYHPINYVDIDTDKNLGTVTSPFNSLVVGFGETGQDAVRYLYEYGAFVDSNSSITDDEPSMTNTEIKNHAVFRSPFHCYVVDKNANNIGGSFFANAPALKNIELWNMDILSLQFYEKLSDICQNLNYVVVALGNNETNITIAVQLFNYIRKHRTDLRKFSIYVRCHNYEQKEHLQHIIDHYNQSFCDKEVHNYIIMFGYTDQLYTYDQIIKNSFIDEGHTYNSLYCEASKDKGGNYWEERHRRLIEKKTLEAFSELRRKESQDLANAYHAHTKLYIMKKVIEDSKEDIKTYLQHIREGLENNSVPLFRSRAYSKNHKLIGRISAGVDFNKEEQLLFLNMARLEHIRWNAAHEILGYQSYAEGDPSCIFVKYNDNNKDARHECNEIYKLHNCLIDWQYLDKESANVSAYDADYKYFDFTVVTATFMLNKK